MADYSTFKKIDSEAIIDGAVSGTKFATDAVTSAKFASASVRTADIADGAVGTTQLGTTLDLSGKTVTYRPIVSADIANSAISGAQLASGAAVTNIGFTPLNKAGGSHSGVLTVPDGTAAAPAITGTSSTNSGIYFSGTNNITVSIGGANVFNLNSNGVPQEPNRPAFYASGTGGWYYLNNFPNPSWREINWTWNVSQQGGSNMSSNGRFTAPVAGWYYFYAQTYMYNDTNNSSGYTHWAIGQNGSYTTSGAGPNYTPHTIFGHGVPSHYVPGIMNQSTRYMNSGDYASIISYMAPVCRFHGDHSLYCGYLIG